LKDNNETPRHRYSSLNRENETSSKYSTFAKDANETPSSKYSSLNRDSHDTPKYSSYSREANETPVPKYSSLSNETNETSKYGASTNGGTMSNARYGTTEEEPMPTKYGGYEAILAKYGKNSVTNENSNGTNSLEKTSQASNGIADHTAQQKLYTNNTFPRPDKIEASKQPTSPSVEFNTNSAFNNSTVASKYTKKDSNSSITSDSLTATPVCRTSQSLAVSTPTYSRSNSNNSTAETGTTPTPSYLNRQISNENSASRGTNGASLPQLSEDNTYSKSLERRSSKKYPGLPGFQSAFERTIEKSTQVADKIEQTLAKHNVKAPEPPSWQARDVSRTRAESVDRSDRSKILQDRGTSPGLETDHSRSSRVGKNSDPYSVRQSTYFKPSTLDAGVQTDQYFLKDRTKDEEANFDYFDHVKRTFQMVTKAEKEKLAGRLDKHKEKEQEDQEKFKFSKAPLTGLLPGYQKKSTENTPYEEALENNLENVSTVKNETESEWETETDEEVIVAKPETPKLEDALAKLDSLDLDSDDDNRYNNYNRSRKETVIEKSIPESPIETVSKIPSIIEPSSDLNGMMQNGKIEDVDDEEVEEEEEANEEGKPTTFISETIDIDDLLCKGSHFVAFDSPVAFEEEDRESKTNSGDFSNAKPISDLVAEEEQPWWNDPQQVAESKNKVDFSSCKKSSALDERPWWEVNKESAEENSDEQSKPGMAVEEKANMDVEEEGEESEWESEYEEAEEEVEEEVEEEDEGEWEYYYEEDEAEEDVSETLDAATKRRTTESEIDERKEWIIQGLQQIIPKMPTRIQEAIEEDNSEGDDNVFDEREDDELKIKQMTEPDQKGYKDWLEEAALDLKENGTASLEIMSPVSEETPSIEETVIELTEEEKKTRAKASKIVEKLKNTEGSELKKVLFSLKTFFQEDKNLVHEFNRVGGLKQLVILEKKMSLNYKTSSYAL